MIRRCQFARQIWEIRVTLVGKVYEAAAHQVVEDVASEHAIFSIDACQDEQTAVALMVRRLEYNVGPLLGPCQ